MGDESILEQIDDLNLVEKDVSNHQPTDSGVISEPIEDEHHRNQNIIEQITPEEPFADSTNGLSFVSSNVNAIFTDSFNATSEHSRPMPKTEEGTFQFTLTNVSRIGPATLNSPLHHIADLPWRLLVKAECSTRTNNKKYLSVYVECNAECDSILWSCDADIKFQLLSADSNREPVFKNVFMKLKYGVAKGFPQFVEWSQLIDPDNEFVKNDKATVEVHIVIHKIIGFRAFSEFDFVTLDVSASRSDALLIVDGKRVRVCKQYLSVYSPVFHAMFFSEFSERDQKEIIIEDLKLDEFLVLLHTIYPTHKPVTKDAVDFLLKLGDRFEVQFVIHECERFLITTNTISISKKLVYADQYCLAKLQDACMKSIQTISDLKVLKQQEEYNEFTSETKAALLERLLKDR